MEFKDYYATLGVNKGSTEKEIKQAFRKLARKHHPDVNPGDKAAESAGGDAAGRGKGATSSTRSSCRSRTRITAPRGACRSNMTATPAPLTSAFRRASATDRASGFPAKVNREPAARRLEIYTCGCGSPRMDSSSARGAISM